MMVLGGSGYSGTVMDVGCVVGDIRMGIARRFRGFGVLVVGVLDLDNSKGRHDMGLGGRVIFGMRWIWWEGG